MTAEEKTSLAGFLDLASDYLNTGFSQLREPRVFKDDSDDSDENADGETGNIFSLPLAYLIDEEEQKNTLAVIFGPLSDEKSAAYLDKMLASIDLYRDKNCAIINTDKSEDIVSFTELHINTLNPKVILFLDKDKMPHAIKTETPVFTTHHPEDIMRDGTLKGPAFKDMKTLMAALAFLDSEYAIKTKSLLKKYSVTDPEFAARVQRLIV